MGATFMEKKKEVVEEVQEKETVLDKIENLEDKIEEKHEEIVEKVKTNNLNVNKVALASFIMALIDFLFIVPSAFAYLFPVYICGITAFFNPLPDGIIALIFGAFGIIMAIFATVFSGIVVSLAKKGRNADKKPFTIFDKIATPFAIVCLVFSIIFLVLLLIGFIVSTIGLTNGLLLTGGEPTYLV